MKGTTTSSSVSPTSITAPTSTTTTTVCPPKKDHHGDHGDEGDNGGDNGKFNKGDHTKPECESTTTTTECKPGNGFGDKNHCHSGPPGHDHGGNDFILIIFIQHFCNWWGNIFGGGGMPW